MVSSCGLLGVLACLLGAALPAGASSSFLLSKAAQQREGPEEEAAGADEGGTSAEGECTEVAKEQFNAVYCDSYMCKECCALWCTEQCDKWKDADRFGKCSCEGGDPEAHSSEEFCKGKNETYWEEHRHLPYEAMQSTACEKGCDSCCAAMKSFLQTGGLRAHVNFELPDSCKICLDANPLLANPAKKLAAWGSNKKASSRGTEQPLLSKPSQKIDSWGRKQQQQQQQERPAAKKKQLKTWQSKVASA